jgi:hypothetical protein
MSLAGLPHPSQQHPHADMLGEALVRRHGAADLLGEGRPPDLAGVVAGGRLAVGAVQRTA